MKLEGSLGRQRNFFVAGETPLRLCRASSSCRAYGCAFAAAGQCANQCSRAGATTNKAGRTLAFAFNGARHHPRIDGSVFAFDGHGSEPHFQQCSAFKVAHGLGVNHSTARGRAFFNHGFPVHDYRLSNCRGESLPRAAALGTERFTQADGNHGPGRNGDGLRTGLLAAGLLLSPLSRPRLRRPALSPAALGLSVEDAGVDGLLAQPITKHSASSATTYNMRIAFKETPSIDNSICLVNYSREGELFFVSRSSLGAFVQCPGVSDLRLDASG